VAGAAGVDRPAEQFEPRRPDVARGDDARIVHRRGQRRRLASGRRAQVELTEWNEFRTPDFVKIKDMLKKPVIFDGRNLYDLDKMKELKFNYYSVGREKITN
jgi:UDPglucose 6-dehydrogenase